MSLKITGGEFCGRIIQAPKTDRTRPTQARLRQALFNSLQTIIPGASVLDLFAGSGALGFEALSRGADQAVFVEDSRVALKLIQKNAQVLRVEDRVHILSEPVERAWNRVKKLGPFDLVLADPPYAGGWEEKLINSAHWPEILKPEGIFCLEWGTVKSQVQELPDETPFLVKVREKNYGDSVLSTYRLKGQLHDASGDIPGIV